VDKPRAEQGSCGAGVAVDDDRVSEVEGGSGGAVDAHVGHGTGEVELGYAQSAQ